MGLIAHALGSHRASFTFTRTARAPRYVVLMRLTSLAFQSAIAATLALTSLGTAAQVEITLRAHVDAIAMKPGVPTTVWRYTGTLVDGPATTVTNLADSHIGPVLRVQQGDTLTVHFQNDLPQPTNVHWHGLDVPADQDGYATDLIPVGGSRDISFVVSNPAGTYWFHPHSDMTTASQVMHGLAGMLVVQSNAEQALDLPSGALDVPIVLQDRTFSADNQLVYAPTMTEHMHGWVGNTITINGAVNTTLSVPTRVHRLRLLNGCNSRSFKLAWSDGSPLVLIGNDGGLLAAPVSKSFLMFGPGERADVWADFSTLAVGASRTLISQSFNPGASQGTLPNGAALTVATFTATQQQSENRTLPATLVPIEAYLLEDAANPTTPRAWPISMAGGEFTLNGGAFADHIVAANEIVPCDTLEQVEVSNVSGGMMTMLAHPIHLHGRSFQILSRTNISGNAANYAAVSPGFHNAGWKDTFLIWPGERVRVLVRWSSFPGDYAYHCHILEHEDMGMMRTVRIEPCPLVGDLNGDGVVNAGDLSIVLSAWGGPDGDVNGDGTTDAGDLTLVFAGWSN